MHTRNRRELTDYLGDKVEGLMLLERHAQLRFGLTQFLAAQQRSGERCGWDGDLAFKTNRH